MRRAESFRLAEGRSRWDGRLERLSGEGQADRLEGVDGAAAAGLDHRADVGVEFGASAAAKAIGHLAEDDAGTDRPLGAVVGRRQFAVGQARTESVASA